MMVPVVAVLLCILLIPFSTSAATGNIITLPGCPATCGNISNIFYPFGIKPGCFRSGFQLTCSNHKLFLGNSNGTVEVTSITINGSVTVNAHIFTMPADADSSRTYWTPLKGGPYTLSTDINSFNVVGCGVYASLADSETGEVISMCSSVCTSNHTAAFVGSDLRSGYGYCYVSINLTVHTQEFEIRLDRLSGEDRASGKAFISSDLIGGSSVVPLRLDWGIRDRSSCMEAKRNMSTYACRSNYSSCWDYSEGYICKCSLSDDGNPYISGGCPGCSLSSFFGCSVVGGGDIPAISLARRRLRSDNQNIGGGVSDLPIDHLVNNNVNCSAPCGNISIPYPFGLDVSCARDENFTLQCNNTTPLLLIGNNIEYHVTNIMVEEGKLLAEISEKDGSLHLNHFTGAIILDWVVDYMSCGNASMNSTNFACIHNHSECQDLKNFTDYSTKTYGHGYRCKCSMGYHGNPYTSSGCIDIHEFNDLEKYKCSGTCNNNAGSFDCVPSSGGFAFDGTKGGTLIGVLVAVGFPLLFLSIRFLYQRWKKRSQNRAREKHFKINRGLLLQQLISSDDEIAERTRIFSFDELAKATNNFDEARVLGSGGHGTVFKGILSDQRVVAIKKSKINVQSEIDQFLNEVVILSQINHRNVVKLFGCCLETEVPLLVYEFVSNGTLSDHLHHPDRKSSLSWEDRLSIARDASGALSYLHSAASISVFHRDVKSSNILLDDHCTAKVSDFGASRSIPLDMTHVITVVQGTFGYLDPEYYHTGQLTEKSDVYSFGVILVELLTGEKPISNTRPEEERNLCTHFNSALRDGRISQIIEARVMEEATREEIDTICKLAETCLRLSGEDRPTMRGVEVSLEGLRRSKIRKKHPWKEPKDEPSASLLPSTTQCGNYPNPATPEKMHGGSNFEEQPMLSLTLPR